VTAVIALARVADFQVTVVSVGTQDDETARKIAKQAARFRTALSAIVLEKIKQAVAFLELTLLFGHDLAPQ
jgi:hypothetical protein